MTFIEAAEDLIGLAEEAREWWDDNSWHYVSSTNVDAFRYDREARALEIQFHGGRVYKYFNIDAGMAAGLAEASSPGGWFHQNLRGAPFERL
jgi:hypothetical protein